MLVEVNDLRVGANLGALIKSARRCRQVVVFERLEMPSRDLGLLRDLLERETAALTRTSEKLTKPGAVSCLPVQTPGCVTGALGQGRSHNLTASHTAARIGKRPPEQS